MKRKSLESLAVEKAPEKLAEQDDVDDAEDNDEEGGEEEEAADDPLAPS